jgi:site-specific DNA recombinase
MTATQAAIYVRISQDRTGAGLGVKRQEQECRALAKAREWVVAKVFCDNDISAYSGKPRPQYEEMLEAIASGRIDAVVVWHTDRLHRAPKELERYIDICSAADVPTHTVQAGVLDLVTPSGRLMARTTGAHARFESEHKAARQRSRAQQAAAAGRPHGGGRRAFGYDTDGVTLMPREAAIIPEIFDRFLATRSAAGVARWVNDRGVPTTRGGQWRPSTVTAVLVNPRYMGVRGMRPVVNKATGVRSPFYDEMGAGTWPALVPEETWRAALRIVKDPSRRTNQAGPARKYLLTGIAECWCGNKLTSGRSRARHNGNPYLKCSPVQHLVRRSAHIENYVIERVLARLATSSFRETLLANVPEASTAEAVREAEIVRGRLTELAEDYASGDMSRLEYQAARAAGRAKLDKLDTTIAAVAGTHPALEFIRSSEAPEVVWERLSLDEKRALVDRLARVRVLPGKPGQPLGKRFDPESVEVIWREA